VTAAIPRDNERSAVKTRDAQRSRDAILDAGERLFAERGFDGATLGDIGALAGLSRGTPSYFFGSKDQLYTAVLERVYAARDAATRKAFAPVIRWAEGDADCAELQQALTDAAEAYMSFVLGRPAFARLIVWEELLGGRGLRGARRESTAVRNAFTLLRSDAQARGLQEFDVSDAELLFIELTFAPLTQQSTFLAALGRDLSDDDVRHAHVMFVVNQLMSLLAGRRR